MPKKHDSHEPENHERWLVSYADFITLLFAFFVVMFASSQTDKARAKQVSEAVEKALDDGRSFSVPPAVAKVLGGTVDDKGQGNAMMKGPGGAKRAAKEAPPEEVIELMPSLDRLNKDLEREIREGKLEIRLEPRGLVISLRQSAFFPSGGDALDPSTLPAMQKTGRSHRRSSQFHPARGTHRFDPHPQRSIQEQLGIIVRALHRGTRNADGRLSFAARALLGGRPRRYLSHRFQRYAGGPRTQPPRGHRHHERAESASGRNRSEGQTPVTGNSSQSPLSLDAEERRSFDSVWLAAKKSKKTLKKRTASSKRVLHARQWRDSAKAE